MVNHDFGGYHDDNDCGDSSGDGYGDDDDNGHLRILNSHLMRGQH